jgi:sugar/nucleoside kinase (ribokinase family)
LVRPSVLIRGGRIRRRPGLVGGVGLRHNRYDTSIVVPPGSRQSAADVAGSIAYGAVCDLLVIGGLGVDIRVRVPALPMPVADSVTVPPIELRIGNTGAGVALAAHALGLRVTVIDTIGADPAGQVVRSALARTDIRYVLRPDPLGTRRSVNLVDPRGRRMSLYDPRGAWAAAPPFDAAELAELTRTARHVHLSIMDWALRLLPTLRAGLAPAAVISTDLHDWDGVNAYHRPFRSVADLVFVSGVALGDRAEAVVRETVSGQPPRTAVVTHGVHGALVTGSDTAAHRVPAATPPAAVVDTNGAGDAFAAGFIAGRLHRRPAPRPAERGRGRVRRPGSRRRLHPRRHGVPA